MRIRLLLAVVAVVLVLGQVARAVSPTPAELAEARAWAAAKFEGKTDATPPAVGLVVVANNDPVQQNGRAAKPLQIGDKQYSRGLFCHAVSKVIVRLPGAAKSFAATIGVDSNEQTRPGRGSVVFSVNVGEKKVFTSPVMREGMPGVPVQVELGDAKELVLEVGDGGDGISCDQADWADARVEMADGTTVWLGDMPISGFNARTFNAEPFFSFTYDGKPSAELLKTWTLSRAARQIDENRIEHTLTYTDPKTGLVLRCVGVEYRDFPTVEWTLYFKNTSEKDTPILADIQALDTDVQRMVGASSDLFEFRLHHQKGAPATVSDYQPFETVLAPGTQTRLSSAGGRPCDKDFPYFNIQQPTSEGLIVAVGWPGQWAATLARDAGNGLRIRAGQELTHFKLLPGEEVRTPLMVLQFWKGKDWIRAQNVWRRWMLAHNVPRPGGKLPPIQHTPCSSHQFEEMYKTTTKDQIYFIDRYIEEGVKPDYWWMDAGWYPCDPAGWPKTGTWEVDTRRFPKGLREVSDHAHSKGVKIIVWFEPERVAGGTWLSDNHPEWIFGGKDGGLLDLGNPQAWKWLTQHVNKVIDDQGIDLYRQDYNIAPLSFWRGADAKDRQGISEIRYVTGYLAYWDDLRKHHPDMLIDSCASGGHRNDLETMRRSVPLLRSDYILEPVGNQGHTYGISLWIPYYGTGGNAIDLYLLRSVMCPGFNSCLDMRRKDLNFDLFRKAMKQWREYAPNFLGDYYPLTPYSLDGTAWMAWQFDRPESGEGMVQAFRHSDSVYDSIQVRLRGLEPDAVYTLTNLDVEGEMHKKGSDLMSGKLSIPIKDQPGSAVILYKKKQ
jgi:alpha-galactosidase